MTSAPKPVRTVVSEAVEEAKTTEKAKSYDLSSLSDIYSMIKDEEDSFIKKQVSSQLRKIIKKSKLDDLYEIVFLYDDYYSIHSWHSNKIYEAISHLKKTKDILLVLLSDGGKIEPAYLISKTCKKLAKDKFVISMPRKAKSAATLLALGADEIHMGLLSELGPIDPQINGFPALGLENALEKIASLSANIPGASEMFAKYLTANLKMTDLGYFGRITESASQYAERLLKGKTFPDNKSAEYVANHFTTHYKDHGFVIDTEEAATLLGDIIKESTQEYDMGSEMYSFLEKIDICYRIIRKQKIRYVGNIENGLDLNDLKSS